jgi:hypothetical protein
LRAYEEKLLQMLLHSQFACPLIARTVSIIPNIQNTLEPVCPCLVFEGTPWGGREAWQVSGKGAAQRDPAQTDRLGGRGQLNTTRSDHA